MDIWDLEKRRFEKISPHSNTVFNCEAAFHQFSDVWIVFDKSVTNWCWIFFGMIAKDATSKNQGPKKHWRTLRKWILEDMFKEHSTTYGWCVGSRFKTSRLLAILLRIFPPKHMWNNLNSAIIWKLLSCGQWPYNLV